MAGVTGAILIGGGLLAAGGMYASHKACQTAAAGHALAQENMDAQERIAAEQLKFQKEEAAKLEAQKNVYKNMVFKNPYATVKNQYANITNPYETLSTENVFEDLTVNTQQAEFQANQAAQQRANIMQQLQGAAGGSGVAALAQSMASQGALQTQQISAQIGQQEAMNRRLQAQGAQDVLRREQVRLAGQGQVDILRARGESAADMARRGGEATLQEMEMSRQATLLGIQMGQTTGANQALQQAYANQMAAGAGAVQMYGAQAAGQYGMAGAMFGAAGSLMAAGGGAAAGSTAGAGSGNITIGGNVYGGTF